MAQHQHLILIAEDDRDIRDLLTVTLESAGFATVAAKDGNTAARILRVARPAGLITDVRMPALNGMELAQIARRDPAIRDTAILMISSNAHAHDIDAGLGAGADRYLPKPISPPRVVAELRDLLESRSPSGPQPRS
ncbi:response regulator [Paractinoplanes deccanensis]|nr:response regulator [Actinoplanes deccanensis]